MKIAISTDGNMVSAHFGRCPSFTLVEVKDNEVINRSSIDNPGHHPGFLPQFLHDKGINVIVAGGMGMSALNLFNQVSIDTIVGVSGSIEDVINKIANGELESGESLCNPGAGKGYGVEKTECEHEDEENHPN
ncbi:MAG: NifB/NifX family molybdenum-iron cluster-binding protein [Candidatus Kaelpia aquatica]|nr:NifB/NifX family molybdenum-iron cluster-binding protein [Candidatus Kaelpia aquatica]